MRCEECNKTFASVKRLEEHQKNYHPQDATLLICQHCKKKLNSIQCMKIHTTRCDVRNSALWHPNIELLLHVPVSCSSGRHIPFTRKTKRSAFVSQILVQFEHWLLHEVTLYSKGLSPVTKSKYAAQFGKVVDFFEVKHF